MRSNIIKRSAISWEVILNMLCNTSRSNKGNSDMGTKSELSCASHRLYTCMSLSYLGWQWFQTHLISKDDLVDSEGTLRREYITSSSLDSSRRLFSKIGFRLKKCNINKNHKFVQIRTITFVSFLGLRVS